MPQNAASRHGYGFSSANGLAEWKKRSYEGGKTLDSKYYASLRLFLVLPEAPPNGT